MQRQLLGRSFLYCPSRVDILAELLDLDQVKRTGLMEQRLVSLEDQVRQKLSNYLRKVGFSRG